MQPAGGVARSRGPFAFPRREMARTGWSVNQLADFSGLARGGVSELLRGERYPTLRTLLKMADAIDVRVKDLLPDESRETPREGG